MSRPSPVALWLIERSVAPHERDPIVGDLVEEFELRAATDPAGANRWLWDQTLRSILPNIRRRLTNLSHEPDPRVQGASGVRMLTGLATDLRFAVRLMRRQPFMTAVALVSLSAGLGLNVLLLTLSDAVLLRPLPLRDPSRLVLLLLQRESGIMHNFSYPEYRDLRDQTTTLDTLVAYSPAEATMTLSEGAVPLEGELVSGNFFGGLGVPLRTGRALTEQDDRAASPPATVISYKLWRDRFGSAPLTGQTISLNREPYTVVGVAASHFQGLQVGRGASFWVPLAHSRVLTGGDLLARPTVSWLTVMGRLRPGTATDAARQELDAILKRLRAASKRRMEPVVLEPGARGDSILSAELESPLRLLLAAGALVLLVACLNVTNLQLARAEARRLELAVRTALGARRSQLVRLMLLDGVLIASVAGAVGVALAMAVKDRAASLIAFYGQPVSISLPLDGRVALAAVLLALLAALVIGLVSTWQIVRRRPRADLGDARAATAARRSVQRALVVAQVALSMALLTGAALLVRTLDRLRGTDLGFESRHVAVLQVSPEMGQLPSAAASAYFDDAVRAVAALPGVQGAAVAHLMPLDFGGSRTSVDVAGYKPSQDEDMELNFVRVSTGYFTTLGLPILQGRAFDESDAVKGQPQRVIVNETMARRYWPDAGAVGSLIRFDDRRPYDIEVIGVVPDVRYRMVREDPRPSFYMLLAQWPAREGVIHVRVAGDPASRIEEIRRVVSGLNPAIPVTRAYTLRDQVERNIADERMAMAIGLTLAVVALVLATAGLYATMAFVVGRRTREIGVRMALGARTTDVRALVLREGVVLALAGVVGGLALSLWAGHALRNQLYGVSQMDVVSFVVAAVILAAAALMASWIPARRAARVDPVVALRDT